MVKIRVPRLRKRYKFNYDIFNIKPIKITIPIKRVKQIKRIRRVKK